MQKKNNNTIKRKKSISENFDYYYNYAWHNLDSLWKHIVLAFFIFAEAIGHHFAWEQQINGKSLYGWAVIVGMESVLILFVKYITNPEYKESVGIKSFFALVSALIIFVQVGLGTLILTSGYSNALANVKQFELYSYQLRELSKEENNAAALINDCLAKVWTKSDKDACQQRGSQKKNLQEVIVSEKDRKMVEQWDSFAATFNGGLQDKTHVKGKVLNTICILFVALIITLSKLALMGAGVHKTKKQKEDFEKYKNDTFSQENINRSDDSKNSPSPTNFSYAVSSGRVDLFRSNKGSLEKENTHLKGIDNFTQNAKPKTQDVEAKQEPQNAGNVVNINQIKTQKSHDVSVLSVENAKKDEETQNTERKIPFYATERQKRFIEQMKQIAIETPQGKMFKCAICGAENERNGKEVQYACSANSTCRGTYNKIAKGEPISRFQIEKINRFMREVELKKEVR